MPGPLGSGVRADGSAMPSDPVYVYQGRGHEYPEHIIIDERNGLLRLTMRGEPQVQLLPASEGGAGPGRKLVEGPTAQLTLPIVAALEMIQRLLELPPLAALEGAIPFVMWFSSETEKAEFIGALRVAKPELIEESLDRGVSRPPPKNAGG